MKELVDEINKLKKERNAVILVHNYQRPEIYDVADYIGDSLDLSRAAAETDAEVIVFCGVDFMAETAKILSPRKKVLLPVTEAKCPMAAMVTVEELNEMKKKYPKAVVVSYVNTTAEIKAESDICCTSSNAVKVVNSLTDEQIIFVPDKNLAKYVESKTDKEIIPWNGFCYVHDKFSAKELKKAMELHPDAEVIVHPECRLDVIKLADYVESTSGILKRVEESKSNKFIIGTEIGLIHRLKLIHKDKVFYSAPPASTCIQMKKNNLSLVLRSLQENIYEIKLSDDILSRAREPIERMLEV